MFNKVVVVLACVVFLAGCGTSIQLKGYEGKPIAHVAPKGCPTIKSGYGGGQPTIAGYPRTDYHHGIDIVAPKGTPVISAGPGVVIQARRFRADGNTIYIYHGSDRFGNFVVSYYSHLDTMIVNIGNKIKRGQTIATMGNTGWSVPQGIPHLHFGVNISTPENKFEFFSNGRIRGLYVANLHYFVFDPQKPTFTAFDPNRDYGDKEGVFTGFTYPVPCGGV